MVVTNLWTLTGAMEVVEADMVEGVVLCKTHRGSHLLVLEHHLVEGKG